MKKYTKQERALAKQKLPRPLQDFLGSPALTDLYVGLMKKHGLTLFELMELSDLANDTLLGLEAEGAFAHNVHQEMPELSNEKTREIVADINDRVFKEAQRRVRENIVNPEESWDEELLGPKSEYEKPISDAELEKRVKEEEARGGFNELLIDEETRAKQAATDRAAEEKGYGIDSIPEEDLENLTLEQLNAKYGPDAGLMSTEDEGPIRPLTPTPVAVDTGPAFVRAHSVAAEKLTVPTVSNAKEKSVPIPLTDGGSKGPSPTVPEISVTTQETSKKSDPYREPLE